MQRVRHKPTPKTRKLVGDLTLNGRSQDEIAKRLGICIESLVKYYHYEIYELRHDINCEIENIALEKARAGDMKAIQLWLKCRAKWAEARDAQDQATDRALSIIEKALGINIKDKDEQSQIS